MPSFTLQPLSHADSSRCVDIYFSAFQNPHSLACWPRNISSVRAWWEAMIDAELSEAGAHWLKAVEAGTGAIAGFVKWQQPKEEEPSTDLPRWPEGADGRLCDETFGDWARKRRELMGRRGHWYLEMVATDPKYQGQGAGSQMVRWGVERADRDGAEAYCEASLDAVPLYEKHGFREARRTDTFINNERVKGELYTEVFMIRPGQN